LKYTGLRLWGNNGAVYDFMRLLLGFWDTPVPSATLTADKSAGATPDEHPKGTPEKCAPEETKDKERFHRVNSAVVNEFHRVTPVQQGGVNSACLLRRI